MKSMKSWTFLAVLSVLATVLLWLGIDRNSLWLDEAMSLEIAQRTLPEMFSFLAGMPEQHPFYYILLRGWLIFGDSEIALRSFSVVFAIASLWAIYILARDLFDEKVARAAAVMMTLSPFYIYYGQEARMYSLLIFLTIVNSYCFAVWQRQEAKGPATGYVLTGLAGVYTHPFFLFLLCAHLSFLVIRDRGFKTQAARAAAWQSLVALGYMPWALMLIRNSPDRQEWKGIEHILLGVPYAFLRFTVGYSELILDYEAKTRILDLALENALILILASIAFGSLAWVGLGYMRRAGTRGLLVLCCLFIPMVLAVLVSAGHVILVGERYLSVSFPFYVMLLAAGACALIQMRAPGRALAIAVGTLWIVVVVKSLYGYYFSPQFGKEQWRDVARYVSTQARTRDVILLEPEFIRFAFEYYYDQKHPRISLPANGDGRQLAIRSAEDYERIWTVSRGDGKGTSSFPSLTTRFHRVSERLFPLESGILVRLYEDAPVHRRTADVERGS